MKKTKITMALLMAAGVFAIASCSKKTDDSTHTRLTGKWKPTQYAIDTNSNGAMDPGEEIPQSDTTYVTFAGDGTGKSENTTGVVKGTFTWTLINNNADIIIKNITGNSAGKTDSAHIETLTSTDLRLSEFVTIDTARIKTWVTLKKQ